MGARGGCVRSTARLVANSSKRATRSNHRSWTESGAVDGRPDPLSLPLALTPRGPRRPRRRAPPTPPWGHDYQGQQRGDDTTGGTAQSSARAEQVARSRPSDTQARGKDARERRRVHGNRVRRATRRRSEPSRQARAQPQLNPHPIAAVPRALAPDSATDRRACWAGGRAAAANRSREAQGARRSRPQAPIPIILRLAERPSRALRPAPSGVQRRRTGGHGTETRARRQMSISSPSKPRRKP